MDTRQCARCKEVKPLEDFPREGNKARGRGYSCKPCKAEATREARAAMDPEQLATQRREGSKAYRAGMRQDKCAVCGTSIQGHGVCVTCEECIDVLGGLEGLKRAVRAVRYMTEK
jgi:hypothetical protein